MVTNRLERTKDHKLKNLLAATYCVVNIPWSKSLTCSSAEKVNRLWLAMFWANIPWGIKRNGETLQKRVSLYTVAIP